MDTERRTGIMVGTLYLKKVINIWSNQIVKLCHGVIIKKTTYVS